MPTYDAFLSNRLIKRLESIKESSDVFDYTEEIYLCKELLSSLLERRENLLPYLNEAAVLKKPVEEAVKLLGSPQGGSVEKAYAILENALKQLNNINAIYVTENQILSTMEQLRKMIETLMKVTIARKMFVSASEIDVLISSIIKVLNNNINDKNVLESIIFNIRNVGQSSTTGKYVTLNEMGDSMLRLKE